MIDLAVVAVYLATTIGLGAAALAWFDRERRLTDHENLLLSFIVGAILFYFGIFAVSSWRLDLPSMGGLTVVALAAAVPGLRRINWRLIVKSCFPAGEPFQLGLLAVAGVVAVLTLLQGLAPPSDYDSMIYHLTVPAMDVARGFVEIPWAHRLPQSFFPNFGTNISRYSLVLAGPGAAQIIHGFLGLAAAVGTGLMARRLGATAATSIIAGIFFLSIRAVIWQMATVETDPVVAAFVVSSMLVYLALRKSPEARLSILFGVVLGGSILTKYHGFGAALAFAPIVLFELGRQRRWREIAAVTAGGVAVLFPFLARNAVITGNPVYPLFIPLFNPGSLDILSGVADSFGTGRSALDLLLAPWMMSVFPMHYFDGMMLGAPYLLALFPMILFDRDRRRRWAIPGIVVAIYFVLWFYLFSQQVRFLIPVLPFVAGMAADGMTWAWGLMRGRKVLLPAFLAVALVYAAVQGMFIGAYAAIRLPVALGTMSPSEYQSTTPTMRLNHYLTCSFLRQNLRPGEYYYSATYDFHSFYCPHRNVVRNYFDDEGDWWLRQSSPPAMSVEEFVRRAKQLKFRYFLVSTVQLARSQNPDAATEALEIDFSKLRFGLYLKPVIDSLEPVFAGVNTAVYDGPSVIAELERRLSN